MNNMLQKLIKETYDILLSIKAGDVMAVYATIYSVVFVGIAGFVAQRNIWIGGVILVLSPVPILLMTILTKVVLNWITDKDNKENSGSEKEIEILIEAPFSYHGQAVYPFTVVNKDLHRPKLNNCYAKLTSVTEVVFNNNGLILLHPHPSNIYPKKIRWVSGNENMDLRRGDPNYLSVLELGKSHFRFLFCGDEPLPPKSSEPQNLGTEQITWLSHPYHLIEITLFGDDANGKPIEFTREFALIFMVSGQQNINFIRSSDSDFMGKPSIDKEKPDVACTMVIKPITSPITSPEIAEAYFRF